jgi:hypothetical protein
LLFDAKAKMFDELLRSHQLESSDKGFIDKIDSGNDSCHGLMIVWTMTHRAPCLTSDWSKISDSPPDLVPANIDIPNNIQRSYYNHFIDYYDPEVSSEGEWIKTLVNRLENTEFFKSLEIYVLNHSQDISKQIIHHWGPLTSYPHRLSNLRWSWFRYPCLGTEHNYKIADCVCPKPVIVVFK